ncbi:hypothetical protein Q9R46_10820 [Paenibacillus sp. RRE4]|uniref:hypothetical protein n=1 Tax=Paenibacillus sp. RRE4 TaxID=2962587 RepID=UPI0028813C1C|nr:hypothetical protein [Paenibacillus sp. RRE4]MDT0123134.1 hypothetical protein [Paenibacillus sp. RRE4]
MQVLEQTKPWVDQVIQKLTDKMDWVSDKSRDKIPYTTQDGVHDDRARHNPNGNDADGISWWTNGFWGGMLWQMYHVTGEEKYKQYANLVEDKLGCLL